MIIGLTGFIGSGKNTSARILVDQGFVSLSFAGIVKDVVSIIFSWDRELLEGLSVESRNFRETIDEYWSNKFGYSVTPRMILQKFATDCCRNNFLESIWIDSLERKISLYKDVVITDVRFSNEIKFLKELKATIIHIDRSNSRPDWYSYIHDRYRLQQMNVHASEYEWFGNKSISKVIYNDRSEKDLEKSILKYLKEIA